MQKSADELWKISAEFVKKSVSIYLSNTLSNSCQIDCQMDVNWTVKLTVKCMSNVLSNWLSNGHNYTFLILMPSHVMMMEYTNMSKRLFFEKWKKIWGVSKADPLPRQWSYPPCFTALKYHSVKSSNYQTIQTIFKHFITLIN